MASFALFARRPSTVPYPTSKNEGVAEQARASQPGDHALVDS
jgi:hypothetical protein